MDLRFHFETRVLAAFVTAIVVVAVLAATTWKVLQDAVEAWFRVSHTHEVLESLDHVKGDALQIELSTQSYRISGDASRLAERDAAIAAREITLRRIKELTADNASQQERWTRLREVVDERIAISRRTEQLRKAQGPEAASAYVKSAPLRETRERMYRLLSEMHEEEFRLLEERDAEQQRARHITAVTGTLAALMLIVLLTATYVLIRRQVRETEASRRALAESNERLEQRVQERTAQLRESEEHLRRVIDNVPALIAYVDSQQCYVYVNHEYRKRFAPEQTDIQGRTVREILGDERYAIAAPRIDKALQGLAQDYDWQPFPDVWQRVNYVPQRDALSRVAGYYVLISDITERKRAAENIQKLNTELEQRVHDLAHINRALKTLSAGNRTMLNATDEQGLLDGMCRAIVDAGGYHMVVVFYKNDDASRTLRPMAETGYPGGLAALRTLKTTWAGDEYGRGVVGTTIRTGQPNVVRNMLTDPNYAPWRPNLHDSTSGVACPLRVDGEIIGALAIYATEPDAFGLDEVKLLSESADDLAHGIATLRARAEQQRTQEAMHRLTRYDALTGLPNETQFAETLAAAIDTGERLNQPFALLQINIERLREINDALGFSHGDQLLREFGVRLHAAAPESAVVARLRGDEFAVLLPDTNAGDAIKEARRLEEVMARPFLIADIPLDVSSNIGIALFPEHGSTPHDLFRHMDMALQQAKKKGVGHDVFAPAQNHDQPRRLAMAGELRHAIEGGDLLLYLQPKVEIATGCVCGAEGLVRWKHAERGLIPPGEFIGLAEHTGLIKPLTEWVIEAALRLNHAWQREGCALPIAVNLSARNLREEDLLEKIRRMMVTWGAGAGLLELEITESAVMEDAEFALRVLHRLRDEGILLYIDDFGTGYSSLSYLQKLPVDYIKIDQSFVRDMSTSEASLTIVRSTIDLAHDLGLKVVAEGVETQENWDQLAALGCGSAQGYFMAKPMPAEEFQNWVRQFRPPVTTPSERT